MTSSRKSVLVFGGSDPSGGAGIQADIEAIAAMGAHALPVITALTVQDNDRVHAIHPVAAALVSSQANALIAKIAIAAVKIGVLGSAENAQAVAAIVRRLRQDDALLPVVLDPVLASGHGDALARGNAVENLAPLLGLATLVTPNLPEAAALCGSAAADANATISGQIHSTNGMEKGYPGADPRADPRPSQAAILLALGCRHVLIKGGHAPDDAAQVVNTWHAATDGGSHRWIWERLPGAFHGSGCTLASAITALLAQDRTMLAALTMAQQYCHAALAGAYAICDGQRVPDRTHRQRCTAHLTLLDQPGPGRTKETS